MILYEELEKRWSGTIWIYSDPHFADKEMGGLRKDYIGDEEQVKRINSKVQKGDTIIFLGDIGDLRFIKKIKGYKVLIMGNHDERSPINYKRKIEKVRHFDPEKLSEETKAQLKQIAGSEDPFAMAVATVTMKDLVPNGEEKLMDGWWEEEVDNHLFDEVYPGPLYINDKVVLSHEPLNPLREYEFNIHGHDHSHWDQSPRHLNVCAEHIDYTPVHFKKLIKEGLCSGIPDIHRLTINQAIKRKAKRNK